MILKILAEEKMVLLLATFFACDHILSQLQAKASYSHGYNVQNLPFHLLYPWLKNLDQRGR